MKKYLSLSAVICISLSLLSGCGGSSSTATEKPVNNATVEASTTQNEQEEKTEKKETDKDTEKPKDVGILSENKKLADGSTAYLDGNTLKIVSDTDGDEYTVYYVFENNKLTIYSEIECSDEETAKLVSDMFNSQSEENDVYDVHTEGTKVCMTYDEAYIESYAGYATAEQIYDTLE